MKHETCELNRGNNVSVPYIVASGFCFIEQELDRIMVRNAVSADERGRTARWVSGEGFETKLDQLGLAYIMIKKRKAGKGAFHRAVPRISQSSNVDRHAFSFPSSHGQANCFS